MRMFGLDDVIRFFFSITKRYDELNKQFGLHKVGIYNLFSIQSTNIDIFIYMYLFTFIYM